MIQRIWRRAFGILKNYHWFRRWIRPRHKDFPWVPENLPADPLPRPLPLGAKDPDDKELASRLQRIYDTISKNIERENALINFRITWACILSAGVLGAEGVIVNYVAAYHAGDIWYHRMAQLSVVILSAIAIYFCIMSLLGVNAAQRQLEYIKLVFRARKHQFAEYGFPRPYGASLNHILGNYTAKAYPIALIFLWFMFFCSQAATLGHLILFPNDAIKPFADKRDTERSQIIALTSQRDEARRELNELSKRVADLSKLVESLVARPIEVRISPYQLQQNETPKQ